MCVYLCQPDFCQKLGSWDLINNAQTCIGYSNFEYLELQIKDHRLPLEGTQNTSIRKFKKHMEIASYSTCSEINNKSDLNSY